MNNFIKKYYLIIAFILVLIEIYIPYESIYIIQTLSSVIIFGMIAISLKNNIIEILSVHSRVVLYLIYLLILVVLSIYRINNINILAVWLRICVIFMSLYMGYYLYGNKFGIILIQKQVIICVILYLSYFLLIQFINFEENIYTTYSGIFNLGSIRNKRLYVLSYLTIILVFTTFQKNKILNYISILAIIMSIIIMLSLRRTAIIVLILGMIVLLYHIRKLKLIFITSLIIIIVYIAINYFYKDIMELQLNSRGNVYKNIDNYQDDFRFLEYSFLFEDIKSNSISWLLFGDKNTFDDRQFWYMHMGWDNSIHADINYIVYSSGFIGLIFVIFIYLGIYKKMNYYYKKLPISNDYIKYKTLFNTIFIMNIAILFSGGIYNEVLNGVVSFTTLGSIVGFFKNEANYYKNSKR